MDVRRRRVRRARAQRFYVAHIENVSSWRPFAGIEDLGSTVPGALLFDRKTRVSTDSLKHEYPTLGS